jgi:acetyl-CoA carboxylase biotin carboxyl carrier protein
MLPGTAPVQASGQVEPAPHLRGVEHREVIVHVIVTEGPQDQAVGLEGWACPELDRHGPIVASGRRCCWTLQMAEIQLETPVTGVVWKIVATPGSVVAAGDTILIMESMKMEIPIESPEDATVTDLNVAEGDHVSEDDVVATIQTV